MDELPATFGKYYLTEKLATGGMAEIYLGKILGPGGFEKQLVIKQIHPRLSGQRQFVDMFVHEAKTLVTLAHGNIVPVYELGVVEDIYFIAMDYIDGPTLYRFTEAAVARGFQLPPPLAAWLAAEVLEGLDYAHRKGEGVIHRDLSPRNVMLSRDGEVKLVDFGIAVQLGVATEDPAASAPTGSFPYMSPEQVRREPLTGQSDLFSVGVLLWEMLTGQRLFARTSPEDTLTAVLEGDILLPSSFRPTVPAKLDDVVAKALARDRDQRWGSAREFLDALNRYLYSLDETPSARDLAQLVARLCPPERRRMPTEADQIAGAAATPGPSTAVMPRDGKTPARAKTFATHVAWKQMLERATPMLGVPIIDRADETPLPGPTTHVTPEGGPAPATGAARSATETEPLETGGGAIAQAGDAAEAARRAAQRRRALVVLGLVAAAAAGVTLRLACTPETRGAPDAAVAIPAMDAPVAPVVVDAGVPDAPPPDAPEPVRRPDARTATPEADARVRIRPDASTATARIDAAPKETGILKVGANPWGNIWINGKSHGRAPKELTLPAGTYKLEVEYPASDPPQRQTRTVEVKAGVSATESFTFTP